MEFKEVEMLDSVDDLAEPPTYQMRQTAETEYASVLRSFSLGIEDIRMAQALKIVCVAHFTRAQVGVCRTQFGTLSLWVRCVVTLHLVRHTTSPHCHMGQARSLSFCLSRSLPAVRWHSYHRQPMVLGRNSGWFSVCGLSITATGLVPFGHGGFYLLDYGGAGSLYHVSGVFLLVGSGPFIRRPVVHGGAGKLD